MQNEINVKKSSILDKKISLRVYLIFLCLILIFGSVLWIMKSIELNNTKKNAYAYSQSSAQALAKSISVFGNEQIVSKNYSSLQRYADKLVSDKPVLFIAIIDGSGRAVVHTDRKYRSQEFVEPKSDENQVVASEEVMDLTSSAAKVWVSLSIDK